MARSETGFSEYWLIDRFSRRMTIYSWHGRRWLRRIHGAGESYRTPILPGFVVPLPLLFARMDEFREQD
jgi:Uma2 family endonuclease